MDWKRASFSIGQGGSASCFALDVICRLPDALGLST
jgi:hypothetical protein